MATEVSADYLSFATSNLKRTHEQAVAAQLTRSNFWQELQSELHDMVYAYDQQKLIQLCEIFDVNVYDWEKTSEERDIDIKLIFNDCHTLIDKPLLYAFIIKYAQGPFPNEEARRSTLRFLNLLHVFGGLHGGLRVQDSHLAKESKDAHVFGSSEDAHLTSAWEELKNSTQKGDTFGYHKEILKLSQALGIMLKKVSQIDI